MKIINSVSFSVDKNKRIFLSILDDNGNNVYKIVEPWIKVKLVQKGKYDDFLFIFNKRVYYEITAPEFIILSIQNYISGKYTNIRIPNADLCRKIKVVKYNGNNSEIIQFKNLVDELNINPNYSIVNRFYYYSYFDIFNWKYATFKDLNVGYFDIEVIANDNKFPSPDTHEYPVAVVSVFITGKVNQIHTIINSEIIKYDNTLDNKNICDIEDFSNISKYLPNLRDTKIHIHNVKNEYELLSIFILICNKINVLSGWNSISFDFKYLYNRAKRIGHYDFINFFYPNNTNIYTIENQMKTKEEYDNIFWKNAELETFEFNVLRIPNLDYNTLIKTALVHNKYPSYKLGFIASKIIDPSISKINININNIMNDINLFIKYNIMDSILVGAIENKMNLIRFLFDVRDIVGFFPLNKINSNVILQSYLSKIFLCDKKNLILDTSKKDKLNSNLFQIYRRVNNEGV